MHRKYIPIYIQQDATLHSLYIWKLLYMFRVVPPPIIRSAYNCIYSIWYLSHRYSYLPLSWKSWNSSTIAAGSSIGVKNIRCCRYSYSCMSSWWWVAVPPETCRAVSKWNKLRNVTSCWMCIREFFKRCNYVISSPKYNIRTSTAKQAIKSNKYNPNICFTQHKKFPLKSASKMCLFAVSSYCYIGFPLVHIAT